MHSDQDALATDGGGSSGGDGRSVRLAAAVVLLAALITAVCAVPVLARSTAARPGRLPLREPPRAQRTASPGAAVNPGLTVSVQGEGLVSYSDGAPPCATARCHTTEAPTQVVFLTATPAQGYTFRGWQGGCVGSSAVCGVTPAQEPAVGASFVHAGGVELTVAGPGTVSGATLTCGSRGTACFAALSGAGQTSLIPTPNAGSTFVGWGGACAQFATSNCSVDNGTFSGATATFAPDSVASGPSILTVTHGTVPVASAPSGLDSCLAQDPCDASVPSGSLLTLTADSPFVITSRPLPSVNWSGACVGVWPVCSLDADGPVNTTVSPAVLTPGATSDATGAQAADVIPVMITGEGELHAARGHITAGGSHSCPSERTGHECFLEESHGRFELVAQPARGWAFSSWSHSYVSLCLRATSPRCAGSTNVSGGTLAAVFSPIRHRR